MLRCVVLLNSKYVEFFQGKCFSALLYYSNHEPDMLCCLIISVHVHAACVYNLATSISAKSVSSVIRCPFICFNLC